MNKNKHEIYIEEKIIKSNNVKEFIEYIENENENNKCKESYLKYLLEKAVFFDSFNIFKYLFLSINFNENRMMENIIENKSINCFLLMIKYKKYNVDYLDNLIKLTMRLDEPEMLEELIYLDSLVIFKEDFGLHYEVEDIIYNNNYKVLNCLYKLDLLENNKIGYYLTQSVIRNSINSFSILNKIEGVYDYLDFDIINDAVNSSNLFIFEEVFIKKSIELDNYKYNNILNNAISVSNEMYELVLSKSKGYKIDYEKVIKIALRNKNTYILEDIFKNKKLKKYRNDDILMYALVENELSLAKYFLNGLKDSCFKGFEFVFEKAIELKNKKLIEILIESENVIKNEKLLIKSMSLEDSDLFEKLYSFNLSLTFNSIKNVCLLQNKKIFDILFERKELIVNIEELILISGFNGDNYIFDKLIKEYNKDYKIIYKTLKLIANKDNSKIMNLILNRFKLSEEEITNLLFDLISNKRFYSVSAILVFGGSNLIKYKEVKEVESCFEILANYNQKDKIKILLNEYKKEKLSFNKAIYIAVKNNNLEVVKLLLKDGRYSNLLSNENNEDILEISLKEMNEFMLNGIREDLIEIKKEIIEIILKSKNIDFSIIKEEDIKNKYILKKETLSNLKLLKYFLDNKEINFNLKSNIKEVFNSAVSFKNIELLIFLMNEKEKMGIKKEVEINLLSFSLLEKNIILFNLLADNFNIKINKETQKYSLMNNALFFDLDIFKKALSKVGDIDLSYNGNFIIKRLFSFNKKEIYLFLFKNAKVKKELMKNKEIYAKINKEFIEKNIKNF